MKNTEFYMNLVDLVAQRSNCRRRKVGAILVNNSNQIIAVGYNGTPKGFPNCDEGGCPRCSKSYEELPSGVGLDDCICIHAELNVIIQCATTNQSSVGATLYCVYSPCKNCVKHLINSEIAKVVFKESYSNDYKLLNQAGIPTYQYSDGILKEV